MTKNEIIALVTSTSALVAVIANLFTRGVINIAQAIQITITFVLVLITAIYVKRTADIASATKEQAEAAREQATASLKMAEEMREQNLAMNRPAITMNIGSKTPGNNFPTQLGVILLNHGRGSAINVELSANHSVFKFNRIDYRDEIVTRGKTYEKSLLLQNDVPPPKTTEPVILFANFEDISGNPWHATLELKYNTRIKDVQRGNSQTAVKGFFQADID